MKNFVPDISTLYRLPYSKNDNPNGWIEITTYCNLRCPSCYRGCNRDDNWAVHELLEKVKETIRTMQHLRNCQIISISGGEPLLHPDLHDIVRFIRDLGMIPFIHTNGLLLNDQLIRSLKQAGLGGLIIRVDSLSRDRKHTEMELNKVRQKYGEMVSAIKGIHLTFLCVVNQENIREIGSVIQWGIQHARLVDFVTFIPMRQIVFDLQEPIDYSKNITIDDLCTEAAKTIPNIAYSSYLSGTVSIESIKWLQSPMIVLNQQVIGFAGPKFIEAFQMMHHLIKGKYAYKFGTDRSYLNILQVLVMSLFFKDFRTVAKGYGKAIVKNPLTVFKRATVQLLCYIVPPQVVNGKADLCDGCPDAILYNGELVPSCALEEIKRFGALLPDR